MENPQQLVAVNESLKLDTEHYGYWKVQMRLMIQSISMEAWFAVEDGWTYPTTTNAEGVVSQKSEKLWTADEKTEAKYNAEALSAILSSLHTNQLTMVQRCTSAKEAWDILQLDMLASEFENLNMEDGESIDDFSIKLISICQEAEVLGKTYNDKTLVKKFLRSLSSKFQPYVSAIEVSLNSSELKFNQVIGMMQAYELKLNKKEQTIGKRSCLVAADKQRDDLQDTVGLIVKKYFRKMKSDHCKPVSTNNQTTTEKENRKSDKQCSVCEESGHRKSECPTIKKRKSLQCFECKGRGYTRADGVKRLESKRKLDVTWSEGYTDEQEAIGRKRLNNLVAHHGIIKDGEDNDTSSTENHSSDSDTEEILTAEELIKLLMTLVEKRKENHDLISERDNIRIRISTLEKELSEEKIKNSSLEKQLSDQMKNIRMLSTGTKDLDAVLSYGRVGSTPFGLGYKGGATSGTTKFIKEIGPTPESAVKTKSLRQTEYHDLSRSQYKKTCGTSSYRGGNANCRTQFVKAHVSPAKPASTSQGMGQSSWQNRRPSCKHSGMPRQSHALTYAGGRATGCWYCGKPGHVKNDCYRFQNRVNQLLRQKKFHKNGKRCNQVYIKKNDLYIYGESSSTKVSNCSHFRHVKAKTRSEAKANLQSVRAPNIRTGCWHCGSQNHYKADCYMFLDRVSPHTYPNKCRTDDQVTDAPVSSGNESVHESVSSNQAVTIEDSISQVHRNHSIHNDVGEIQGGSVTKGSRHVEQQQHSVSATEGSQQVELQQQSVSVPTTSNDSDTALGSSCTQPMMMKQTAVNDYGMIPNSLSKVQVI